MENNEQEDIKNILVAELTGLLTMNGVLRDYCKYSAVLFKERNGTPSFGELNNNELANYIAHNGLSGAFSWGETEQGYRFWRELSSQWYSRFSEALESKGLKYSNF